MAPVSIARGLAGCVYDHIRDCLDGIAEMCRGETLHSATACFVVWGGVGWGGGQCFIHWVAWRWILRHGMIVEECINVGKTATARAPPMHMHRGND